MSDKILQGRRVEVVAVGMRLCARHLAEIRLDERLFDERMEWVEVEPSVFDPAPRCQMCDVVPAQNSCAACGRPLHPQWPAIYCNNACALEDR